MVYKFKFFLKKLGLETNFLMQQLNTKTRYINLWINR